MKLVVRNTEKALYRKLEQELFSQGDLAPERVIKKSFQIQLVGILTLFGPKMLLFRFRNNALTLIRFFALVR